MIFHRDLVENLHVCTNCGHHMRLPAKQRLAMLFDDGAYDRIDTPKVTADPLRFRDRKRYTDRLREAQAKTDETDAIQVGEGRIGGVPAVVAVFDFDFLGGSMGMGVGEGLVKAAAVAVARVMLREQPVVQRRARPADVQESGGRGGKAGDDRHGSLNVLFDCGEVAFKEGAGGLP